MITGPLQDLSRDGLEVHYDRRWLIPAYVCETYVWDMSIPATTLRIDRRLHPDFRTGPHDYDGLEKYKTVSLGGNKYSSALPMTPGCFERYQECMNRISALANGRKSMHDLNISWSNYLVRIAKGPAFDFGKKIFRLREKEGPAIPHYIWVAVLCDFDSGVTKCWSFLISNVARPPILDGTIVPTSRLERMTGIRFWKHYDDPSLESSKQKVPSKWW